MKKINLIFIGIIIFIGVLVFGIEKNKNENKNNFFNENKLDNLLERQISEDGDVTITLIPLDQTNLNFKITLETHSVDLDYDLSKVVILVDENGDKYKPISWEGDLVGGHHRQGILRFDKNITTMLSTLIIKEIGGIGERRFELSPQRI